MLLDCAILDLTTFLSLCILSMKRGGEKTLIELERFELERPKKKKRERRGFECLYCILQQRSWWPCFQNGELYAIHKLERFLEADVCMCFFHLSPDLANKT